MGTGFRNLLADFLTGYALDAVPESNTCAVSSLDRYQSGNDWAPKSPDNALTPGSTRRAMKSADLRVLERRGRRLLWSIARWSGHEFGGPANRCTGAMSIGRRPIASCIPAHRYTIVSPTLNNQLLACPHPLASPGPLPLISLPFPSLPWGMDLGRVGSFGLTGLWEWRGE